LALHICEAAAQSEANAKEATKRLRKTLKWGDPGPQLSAARLWAIMIRNASPFFLVEATSPKFLAAVEDVITKPTTTPVVKARVLEVLSGATHAYPGLPPSNGPLGFARDKIGGYGTLWKKVKPPGYPDDGIPFDPSDPMFSPPDINTHPKLPNNRPNHRQHHDLPPLGSPKNNQHPTIHNTRANSKHRSRDSHDSHLQRIIPIEEDVKRLFEECEMAKGNAHVLNQALAYASPEELEENTVIREYYDKCQRSEDLLSTQVGWAASQAKRYRELEGIPPESFPDPPHPKAEQLLQAILDARTEIADVFRIYDDLRRLGEEAVQEREAEERSKRDVRLDRSQIQYIHSDGSFQMQTPSGGVGVSGPSRSPSPLLEATPYSSANANGSQLSLNSTQFPSSQSHSAQNSQQHLGLPHLARPHGPRKPISRSRSPSPERNPESNYVLPRLPFIEADHASRQVQDDSSDDFEIPIQPSAKAKGKKRMDGSPVRSETDEFYRGEEGGLSRTPSASGSEDSRARPRWKNQPRVYAYDAMAERTKVIQMEEGMRRLLKERG